MLFHYALGSLTEGRLQQMCSMVARIVNEVHNFDDQKAICDQFLKFCRDQDIVQAEYFLNNGLTDINCSDDDGLTPLQLTSAYNHLELTESLINNGASIDTCNNYGFTALHHACFNGNAEIVTLLLRKNADIEYRNIFGCSPLALACKKGQADVAKILLENGAEIENEEEEDFTDNSECCHPLLLAVIYSHESVVRILLENGANVNKCVQSTGYSPLMYAASRSTLTIVQLLLDNGAQVDYRCPKNQKTALDLAILRSNVDIVAVLEQWSNFSKNSRSSTLASMSFKFDIMEAIKREDYSRVEEILRTDNNSNDQNFNIADTVDSQDGSTPLILASIRGNLETCRLLVAKKAHLDRKDKIKGWTALMQACFFRNVAVAKYLIWAGADCTLKSDDGYTALDLAIISDYSNIPDEGLLALLSQKCVQQEEEILTPPKKSSKGHSLTPNGHHNWRRFASNYSLPRRKRTLSTSSTSIFQFFGRKIRTPCSMSGESTLKVGGSTMTATRRWSLKPRNWWNRFKMRLRHRSNSSTTLASAPLLNNGKLCTFSDNTAFSLPMKNSRKSQSVGDLLHVKVQSSKSCDQALTTLIQTMNDKPHCNVIPPFDPRDWNLPVKIKSTCQDQSKSDVKKCHVIKNSDSEENLGLKPSLAMQNAFKMRPPKRLPERTSPMHKYENIMAALNLPIDLHQNESCTLIGQKKGGASSPNSSFSLSSISNGSTCHFSHFNNHASSYSHTVHGPLITGMNNKRRGQRCRHPRRPHSYHDVFDGQNPKFGSNGNMASLATSLGASRPRVYLQNGNNNHRFHAQNGGSGHVTAVGQQPLAITPTRKLMFKFTEMQSLRENNEPEDQKLNDNGACQITKFNSSPLLNEKSTIDQKIELINRNHQNFDQDPLSLINKRLSQITTNFSVISGLNNLHLNNSDKLKLEENQNMQTVLKQIAGEPYSSVFDDEEMDLDTFLTLTDGDLREMGLQDPNQRHEILKLVRQANLMIKNSKNTVNSEA